MLERMAEEALEKLEGEQSEVQDERPEGEEGAEEEVIQSHQTHPVILTAAAVRIKERMTPWPLKTTR